MSGKKSRRKHRGHYCWACDTFRSNESFSGKGHARHLCRECTRLSAEELAYRQALRDLDRCVTREGIIPRKRSRTFSTFLDHADPRIRQLALEMQEEDLLIRRFSADGTAEATLRYTQFNVEEHPELPRQS